MDIFKGVGVEVTLNNEEDFLVVKETLTRIGIASKKTKNLYQSVYLFHKQGRYSLVHFKSLFLFDGKPSNISENDIHRLNTIAKLLSDWGLVKLLPGKVFDPLELAPIHQIKIISYRDKENYNLVSKYNIGKKLHI